MGTSTRRIVFLVSLTIVVTIIAAGCGQPTAQQEIESAVEATVEQTQTDVDTIFTDLETAVNDALEKVGNLPSQQDEAQAIIGDLQDISSRVDDAIKSGDDDQLETFQNLGNAFDAVINNVSNSADDASGEQQVALQELAAVLVGAKSMLADSIANMMGVEVKATLAAEEVEAAEAAATAEAEEAEAAATAETEEVDAAATAASEEVEAVATAETEEVDAVATAEAEEEAEETPAASD